MLRLRHADTAARPTARLGAGHALALVASGWLACLPSPGALAASAAAPAPSPGTTEGSAARAAAGRWLARADRALTSRNYIGVFVHEHAGESETLKVIHRVGPHGAVSERLLSMDGSGREFIREGSKLLCYLPDEHVVLVERSPASTLLGGAVPRIDPAAARQYRLLVLPQARVSGHKTREIEVLPLDAMRYGYRIWIDEASAMPIKTQLRSRAGRVLEQIVFTSLQLPSSIPASELQPGIDTSHYRWLRQRAAAVAGGVEAGSGVSWQAASLPPGFHIMATLRQVLPIGPVRQLVFSDGLASVSVFVQGRGAAQAVPPDATERFGSSSAYSTVVRGYRITAIGAVPAATVRRIAHSVRPMPTGLPDAHRAAPPR